MRVLVACEFSGTVSRAFRARGHEAWSCDLLPSEDGSPFHIQGDVLAVLDEGWDLMVAHPPCTHLCTSGARWFAEKRVEQAEALDFVRALLDASVDRIALENPVGVISSKIRKPTQIIHPHMFGENAAKSTCLWLKNLPALKATQNVPPAFYTNGLPRWGNQSPGGSNRYGPSPDRWKIRSRTFPGIALAMAAQWSKP